MTDYDTWKTTDPNDVAICEEIVTKDCLDCDGAGEIFDDEGNPTKCDACDGNGEIEEICGEPVYRGNLCSEHYSDMLANKADEDYQAMKDEGLL
jgi:hypothetical protein